MRVVVADDHPVFRAGLRALVEDSAELLLVGEAVDGGEAIKICAETRPDVVLLDIRMPGISGIDAARAIVATEPGIGVLMLTMLEDDTSVFAALRAGARGYVLKGAAPTEIVRAIVSVAAGEFLFGAAIAVRMAEFFRGTHKSPAATFPGLSTREHDILDLVAAGCANAEIAVRLSLSEKTVRNNVSNIFAKLRVTDRAGAIVRAREAGLGHGPPA